MERFETLSNVKMMILVSTIIMAPILLAIFFCLYRELVTEVLSYLAPHRPCDNTQRCNDSFLSHFAAPSVDCVCSGTPVTKGGAGNSEGHRRYAA